MHFIQEYYGSLIGASKSSEARRRSLPWNRVKWSRYHWIYETIKAPLIIQIIKLAYARERARAAYIKVFRVFRAPRWRLSIKLGTTVSRDDRGIMPEFAISDYSVRVAKLSGCARDTPTAAVNYSVVSGMSPRLFLLQDTEAKSTIIGKVIREKRTLWKL